MLTGAAGRCKDHAVIREPAPPRNQGIDAIADGTSPSNGEETSRVTRRLPTRPLRCGADAASISSAVRRMPFQLTSSSPVPEAAVPVIETRELRKHYGGIQALRGVTLSVE